MLKKLPIRSNLKFKKWFLAINYYIICQKKAQNLKFEIWIYSYIYIKTELFFLGDKYSPKMTTTIQPS